MVSGEPFPGTRAVILAMVAGLVVLLMNLTFGRAFTGQAPSGVDQDRHLGAFGDIRQLADESTPRADLSTPSARSATSD